MGLYYEPNGAGPFYTDDEDYIPAGSNILTYQQLNTGELPMTFDINTPLANQLLFYTSGGVWVNRGPSFGNLGGGNYTAFENDGTMKAYGDATCHLDELGPLIGYKLESPASHITYNLAEGTVTYDDACTLSDYIVIPFQLNHDRVAGSQIGPHIHWWQTSANVPNWLIQYRWQVNGQAKTTAWSSLARLSDVYTYAAGTLNQISIFSNLSPPDPESLSMIVQIRLYRDTTNASGLFAGADPLVGDVDVMQLDVHKIVDMLGSRSTYAK